MEWKIHQDRDIEAVDIDSYTITLRESKCGWHSDGGYPGYGLPKNLALWICDVLNKHSQDCPYKMDEYGNWERI